MKDRAIGRFGRATRLALAVALGIAALPLSAPAAVLAEPTYPAPTVPAATVPAPAVPGTTTAGLSDTQKELAALLAQRQQVQAQISVLEPQLEIATEEYNNAEGQLARASAELEQATSALATAQADLVTQREAFNTRLVAMYRTGDYGAIELFLSIDSVTELVNRLDFFIKMGDRDAEVLKALAQQEQTASSTRDQLAALQQQLTVLELQTAQKKHDVERMMADQKALYDSLGARFQELLAQQAQEQQAQQAQMLADIRANSGRYGIDPQPGSPVETVLTYLGIPYVWGGDDPINGFDCSGLMMYVMRQHGIELPHYSRAQFEIGLPVDYAQLAPGDLVFFGSPIHHVGMYIGGGYFVHAPKTGDFVKISKLADRSDFAGGRRYPWLYKTTVPGAPGSTTATGTNE